MRQLLLPRFNQEPQEFAKSGDKKQRGSETLPRFGWEWGASDETNQTVLAGNPPAPASATTNNEVSPSLYRESADDDVSALIPDKGESCTRADGTDTWRSKRGVGPTLPISDTQASVVAYGTQRSRHVLLGVAKWFIYDCSPLKE
ncbi:hypothetical protein B296_00017258 [Ensete ventricosum]|uniref:Uncharacterized protein n=1 Tax=Ensete ventricosum TaxID=4639 RepID=A0A426Z803_ENSVE|nr:hypothetical protein B296_00017258 [Ensete ventricosum]